MLIARIIATVLALVVLVKSYDEFRRGREPWLVFTFWLTCWTTVLAIAFFPGITDWLKINILGSHVGIGTYFGIAGVFMLYLSYRIYLKASRIEQDVNRLISDLAVRDIDAQKR